MRLTPHQWRHTLGTRLINKDVPQEVVRRILDHDSPQMTAHYARLHDTTVRRHWEAARKVDASSQTVTLNPEGPLAEAAWAKQRIGRAECGRGITRGRHRCLGERLRRGDALPAYPRPTVHLFTGPTSATRRGGPICGPIRGWGSRCAPANLVRRGGRGSRAMCAAAAAVVVVLVLAAGCSNPASPGAVPGPSSGPGPSAVASPAPAPVPALPGGGQTLFPGRRLVALHGHPGAPELGVLGAQDLPGSIARAQKLAASYAPLSDVPVVTAFEIIATTASSEAGPDGDYSSESSVESLRPWVEQAAAAGMYVVLDLQPGRADFLAQARRYTALLRLPGVGLALDAEWHLNPGQKPLRQIGDVDAADINAVTSWLAGLTATAHLPQKLLVLHQFQLSMIRNEPNLDTHHPQVQLLVHMDGNGLPALKDATWRSVTTAAPPGMPFGWKNFYHEDTPMLDPAQTMAHHPAPLMIPTNSHDSRNGRDQRTGTTRGAAGEGLRVPNRIPSTRCAGPGTQRGRRGRWAA